MEYRQLGEKEYSDIKARILHEDNHILVFSKNAGEIVQGDKTGDECLAETLKAFIAQRDGKPGKVFLGIPHRLARPVSGIVVYAKTSKALSRLSEMFRNGGIQKTYWALCCNEPERPSAELDDWLVRVESKNKTFIARENAPGAKLARLIYKVIGHTDRYTLLEVTLLTGRHHQIRCQLSAMGCPIKGDLKYGAPRSNPDGGICLHSHRIQFVHPVSKEGMDIVSPPPASWKGIRLE